MIFFSFHTGGNGEYDGIYDGGSNTDSAEIEGATQTTTVPTTTEVITTTIAPTTSGLL